MVIRNSDGGLIRAHALWYDDVADARAMEARATRDGLRLASDLGYNQICFKSDALDVVKLCNSKDFTRTNIGGMCRQVVDLASSFISCSLSHVSQYF